LELPEKNGTSKNAPFCGSFLEVSQTARGRQHSSLPTPTWCRDAK
jgi:hypothetical protein